MRHVVVLLVMIAFLGGSAEAAKKRRPRKKGAKPTTTETIVIGGHEDVGAKEKSTKKEKVFDFTDFSIEGKLRTPQLLYFLGRARQELERASLEKRTFIPEMVRSVDEGGL